MVFMIDESLRFIITMFVLTCSGLEGTAALHTFDCDNPSEAFVVKAEYPLGCAGALWSSSGAPSPGYCTNTGADAKGRFGWHAQCCIWTSTNQCVDKSIVPDTWCDADQAPSGGCAGAVWHSSGAPSRDYCTNTGVNALGRYSWYAHCCEWVTSTAHSGRCEPKQFNCDEGSAQAPSGGCAGAMWGVYKSEQAPSYPYCTNTAEADNRFRWHAQCCKWTGTGQCVHKAIDLTSWCEDLSNAPVILTGFAAGCGGAVWSGPGLHTGEPSRHYCQNIAPNTAGRYGWYRHCCVWTGTSCAHKDLECPAGICRGIVGQFASLRQKRCEGNNPADKGDYEQQAYCCEWSRGQSQCEQRYRECRVDDRHASFVNQHPGVVTDVDPLCQQQFSYGISRKRQARCYAGADYEGEKRCRWVPEGIMCSPNKNATLVNRTTTSLRKEQTKPQQLQTKYEWDVTYPSCNRGYWASGCGQPAMEQKGVVRCYGNTLKGSWVDDDAKCTGKKPDATRTCPATAKCPRCKGCKRDGGCWKICGGKAGKCSACDSHDGREGACCRQGAKDDPIECELAEYQFSGEDHTCALLPADDHTGSLMIGIISRLKQLETTIKGMLGL